MANDSKANDTSHPQQSPAAGGTSPREAGDVLCLYEGWDRRRVTEHTSRAFIELHDSYARRAGEVPRSVDAVVRAREKRIEGKRRIHEAAHVEFSEQVWVATSDLESVIDAKRCLRVVAEVLDDRQSALLELLASGATAEDWEAYERAANIPPNARHFRVHALRKCLRETLSRRGFGEMVGSTRASDVGGGRS